MHIFNLKYNKEKEKTSFFTKVNLVSLFVLFIFSISFSSAFDFPHTIVTIDFSGNLTNLSEMADVNIPGPTSNQVLQFDSGSGLWIASTISGITDTNASTACTGSQVLLGNGSCGDISAIGGDTNETTRFNALVNTNCTGTDKMTGNHNNGTPICAADQTGAGGTPNAGDGVYLYNASGEMSFNETLAGTNLSVNDSDYWDSYDTANSTWFQNIGGALSLKLAELTSYLNTWFSGKDTDDLTEGSTNLYDNSTFNQTLTDVLYSSGSDNVSWNESHANTLYYDLGNSFGFYNLTDFDYTDFYNNITNFTGTLTDGKICIYDNDQQIINCTYTDQTGASGNTKKGDGIYLFNDTDTMYFNDTKMNITIDNRDTDTNTNCSVIGSCPNIAYNLSAFDTDDLTEGSTNLYDDQSWNKTYADGLYYDLGNSFSYYNSTNPQTETDPKWSGNFTAHNASWSMGNDSWNEVLADGLYSPISEPLSLHLNQDNWNNDSDGYVYWSGGDTITFNQTKLITQFFNASAIDDVVGTGAGVLGGLQNYNGITYNISEASSDIDLRINFSGIEDFNNIIIRYRSPEEDGTHTLELQVYEPGDDEWEDYGILPGGASFQIAEFGVFDADEHIGGDDVVQVRLYQDEGVPFKTHKHEIDWVSISKGLGTPAGQEVDPLSVHLDGDIPLSANWDQGDYNFTNLGGFMSGTANNTNNWITPSNGTLSDINVTHFENENGLLTIIDGLFGMITSVVAGNGMDFSTITSGAATITMGTPGTLNAGTANGVSSTSHLHAITSATPSDGDTTSFSNADEIYDWVIGLGYYSETNPFGFYNSTDFDIADYYLNSNPFSFYNSTNPQTETDPKWASNLTAHNASWSASGGNSSWNETHADTLYVELAGDTMTGNLDMGANNITTTGWADVGNLVMDLIVGTFSIFQNSDFFNVILDGTDARVNWTDGDLILTSTEANTVVQIGKNDAGGSGTATLRLQDDSGAYITEFIQDDGTLNIQAKSSGAFVVINDDGDASNDFRAESVGNTHMFFLDAGLNRVGFNKSSPNATVDIDGNLSVSGNITASECIVFASGGSICSS